MLLFFDDMIEQPQKLLQQTCAFLGIDHERAEIRQADEPVKVGKPDPMPPDLYDTLRDALAPDYQRLLSLNIPIVQK